MRTGPDVRPSHDVSGKLGEELELPLRLDEARLDSAQARQGAGVVEALPDQISGEDGAGAAQPRAAVHGHAGAALEGLVDQLTERARLVERGRVHVDDGLGIALDPVA